MMNELEVVVWSLYLDDFEWKKEDTEEYLKKAAYSSKVIPQICLNS